MPHYFFDLFNDEVTIDHEGAVLPDVETAIERGRAEARILAAESVVAHGHLVLTHHIIVRDAKRTELARISFGDVVEVKG